MIWHCACNYFHKDILLKFIKRHHKKHSQKLIMSDFTDSLIRLIKRWYFDTCLSIIEQSRGIQVFLSVNNLQDITGVDPDYTDTFFNSSNYALRFTKRAQFVKLVLPPTYRHQNNKGKGPIVLCEVEVFGTRMYCLMACLKYFHYPC